MYTLYGDGVHDDTMAIREMLDSGICEVALPAPQVKYCKGDNSHYFFSYILVNNGTIGKITEV